MNRITFQFTLYLHSSRTHYLSKHSSICRTAMIESFGDCETGSTQECCNVLDAPCNVKCHPDLKCRYADWVLSKSGIE